MRLEPCGWNIVVIGDWNIAILTPDGVRRHLFHADANVQLNIELQIDRPGPFRLTHAGIMVTPSPTKLEVGPVTANVEQMAICADIATRALNHLPLTPISAVGVNFRYKIRPLPPATLELLDCTLDTELAADFEVQGGLTVRMLRYKDGLINVEVSTAEPEGPNILVNFHRVSSDGPTYTAWLAQTREFHVTTEKLLKVLGL